MIQPFYDMIESPECGQGLIDIFVIKIRIIKKRAFCADLRVAFSSRSWVVPPFHVPHSKKIKFWICFEFVYRPHRVRYKYFTFLILNKAGKIERFRKDQRNLNLSISKHSKYVYRNLADFILLLLILIVYA